MGLFVSRIILNMEAQQAQRSSGRHNVIPSSERDSSNQDEEIFHPSKALRIFLGAGLAIQAAIVCFAIIVTIFNDRPYYYDSLFTFLAQLVITVYTFPYLYASSIWFICLCMNTTIPCDKKFIIIELVRVMPLLVAAIISIVLGITSLIYQIFYDRMNLFNELTIVLLVIFLILIVLVTWVLVWMFKYFLLKRQEEIKKVLKIGQPCEDEQENQPARRDNNDNNGRESERRETEEAASHTDEDAPLLIDNVV